MMALEDEIIDALKERYDESKAKEILDCLRDDAKRMGKSLKDLLAEGDKVITGLNLSLVSGVDGPAQTSQWWMLKSDNTKRMNREFRVLLKADDERQISYAPVLIPGMADKQNDIIPSMVIEETAHEFLMGADRDAIDVNHDRNKGKGHIVESWILQDDQVFKDIFGEEVEYPKGTWLMAVKWNDEAWELVKNNEIQGFSIDGFADMLELGKSVYLNEENNKKVDNMSEEEIEETEDEVSDDSEAVDEEDIEEVEGDEEESEAPEDDEDSDDEILDRFKELEERLNELWSRATDEEGEKSEKQDEELSYDNLISLLADVLGVPVDDVSERLAPLLQSEDSDEEDEEDEEKTANIKGYSGDGLRDDIMKVKDGITHGRRDYEGAVKKMFNELRESD